MESISRHKTLDLQRGLFLVKYEAADSRQPPTVTLSIDPDSESEVDIILPPTVEDATLWSPGACLVARCAKGGGRLRVAVTPSEPNGSTAARIQVIPLLNDPTQMHTNQPAKTPNRSKAAAALDLSGFRLVGHVAGIGDVFASAESWIAGPMAPSRIEGLLIEWPAKPGNLDFSYAVRVGGPRPATSEPVEVGKFAGTRGRSLPLVGATLEISGSGAEGHRLAVDAIFLGSPQMRVTGQRVVLSGPTGREPMVGLRVGFESTASVKPLGRSAAKKAAAEDADSPATELETRLTGISGKRTGRVRVFRSAKKRAAGARGA
jgi:hypothetical protein